MEDVLFYTFSTIAATFGSAVSLIVAATVFRMQRIDQVCMALANALMQNHGAEAEKRRLGRIIMVQDWGKFIQVWGEYHPTSRPKQTAAEADYLWLLDKTTKRLRWIRIWTYSLVYTTLVLIAFCFCCIPYSGVIGKGLPSDNPRPWQAITALIVALLVLVGYVVVSSMLIAQPVDYEDRPEDAS
jgi:hypothetical protein